MRDYFKELDVYSGIAIIFVVLIHANGGYLSSIKAGNYVDGGFFILTIDQIIHIAVPMFIFAAGFKYKQPKNYKTYFIKRLNKVVIPFLFVSMFFILKSGLHNLHVVGFVITIKIMIVDTLRMLFGYNYAYQLWYIPMYLFVVLLYPIIKKYIKSQKNRFILFGTLSISFYLLFSFTKLFIVYDKPFAFVYYFLFFELGCYIAENALSKKNQYTIFISYILLLITSIFTAKELYGTLVTKLILTPVAVVAFYYASVYLKDNRVLSILGKYSFYVFLFHEPVILCELTNFFSSNGLYTGYYITLLITVLTIFFSIVLYEILKITKISKFIFYQK